MENIPRLRRGFRFQWEPAQQSHVLLYPEGMVKLNDSAGAILAEVDGVKSRADIVAALEARFPDAGALSDDVVAFLDEASRQHWIEWL